MEKLEVKLENCYWIKSMNETFDFTDSNVYSIYAKNWSMKTSFTKVFEKYQEWKEKDIKDEIFWIKGEQNITIDWKKINSEEIYTIWNKDLGYDSNNISSLLLNKDLKEKFDELLEIKFQLLTKLKDNTWLAIPKINNDLNPSKLEEKICKDFGYESINIFESFQKIKIWKINDTEIIYKEIFDNSTLENTIWLPDFQSNLKKFKEKWDEIYKSSPFLEKWEFTFWNFIDVCNTIEKNNFFVKKNWLILNWKVNDKDLTLSELSRIKKELKETEEFMKISEKLNSTIKGKNLLNHLDKNLKLIADLYDYKNFRKRLWYQYLTEIKDDESWELLFDIINKKYKELKESITKESIENSKWEEAVNIFNSRFSMPFKMKVENLEWAVFWEIPKIVFHFCKNIDNHDCKKEKCLINWNIVIKNKWEFINTLSQWEKRALYLLNVIFDIEKFKEDIKNNKESETIDKSKLLIIDDIADSFDYKNKYAIIEYLREISEEYTNISTKDWIKEVKNFKMIILTHNFDFFRFISKRLKVNDKKFEISVDNKWKIKLIKSIEDEPWKDWKGSLCNKNIIALIPFVRNLIEYWDYNAESYMTLTHLLHKKNKLKYDKEAKILRVNKENNIFKWEIESPEIIRKYSKEELDFEIKKTEDIMFCDIEPIYIKYLWISWFKLWDNNKKSIYEAIKSIHITESNLEDKIILSKQIRYEVEEFMISKVSENFTNKISGSQTWELIKKIKKWQKTNKITNNQINILDSVSIMTPENIHINSFMYEPILDMDITELQNLYEDVKELNKN